MIKGKWIAALLTVLLCMSLVPVAAAEGPECQLTGYLRNGRNLSAKLINPAEPVTGMVDATGCDVGIYYGAGSTGLVSGAEVYGALYFGIMNHDANVVIEDSKVHTIGDTPFNGNQRGVGIYFLGPNATGSVTGNEVYAYQKGGIVVSYGSATVANNTVTGFGPVGFIAQNGIQLAYTSGGIITNNIVTGNWYTGPNWASSGILLVETSKLKVVNNEVMDSNVGIYSITSVGTKFITNDVSGCEWDFYEDGPSGSKIHANSFDEE